VRNLLLHFILCLAGCFSLSGCASPFSGLRSSLSQFEQSHVFLPDVYPEGNWQPAGFEFEDAWFTAPDGARLNGWFLDHEKPAAVILLAHGNAGNVTTNADLLRMLHDRHHASVLIFDYRGYGKSEGKPDERGILDDARAARSWLARRANIEEHDIVLMGESLGGGVMVDLAAEEGARGLILLSTFTSLPDVASRRFPLLPARALMHNHLDSVAKIGKYHGPLLQAHGEKDHTVSIALGKRLFDAANEPKQFIVNSGADHNDPLPETYWKALDAFLASLPLVHPRPESPRWHRTRTAQ